MSKVYTRFQTKKAQNPTRWGGTYLYGFNKGVSPPRTLSQNFVKRKGYEALIFYKILSITS